VTTRPAAVTRVDPGLHGGRAAASAGDQRPALPGEPVSLEHQRGHTIDGQGWTSAYTATDTSRPPLPRDDQSFQHDMAGRVVSVNSGNLAAGCTTHRGTSSPSRARPATARAPTPTRTRRTPPSCRPGWTSTMSAGDVQLCGSRRPAGGHPARPRRRCRFNRTLTYDAANRVQTGAVAANPVTMGYNALGQRSRYQVEMANGVAGRSRWIERFGYTGWPAQSAAGAPDTTQDMGTASSSAA